jgi:hypothetical protein
VIRPLAWLFLFALALAGCGGSGGAGGPGANFALSGRVFWVETGTPPIPEATVRVGIASTTTDLADGFFQLDAPAGTTSLTVAYQPSGGAAVQETFSFDALAGDADVGDLYIGPQVVSVEGRTVDAATGSAVAGATVSLAGRRATSGADGRFRLQRVAFSPRGLTVFLGLLGQASANGYFVRSWSPVEGPSGGVSRVGDIALTAVGSPDPPPSPFNVEGVVLPAGEGGGADVSVLKGASVLRRAKADASGKYRFWLAAGTYTLRAVRGTRQGERAFTIQDATVVQRVDVALP